MSVHPLQVSSGTGTQPSSPSTPIPLPHVCPSVPKQVWCVVGWWAHTQSPLLHWDLPSDAHGGPLRSAEPPAQATCCLCPWPAPCPGLCCSPLAPGLRPTPALLVSLVLECHGCGPALFPLSKDGEPTEAFSVYILFYLDML